MFSLVFPENQLNPGMLGMGYSFGNVPQLHRLSANGMKLCGIVGLVNVSIAVDLKSSKNLANRSKSGDKLESTSQKLTSGMFPL